MRICTSRFAFVAVDIILIFAVISEALPIARNPESNNVIRDYYYDSTGLGPSSFDSDVLSNICQPRLLDPAIDCGCYAYKDEYMGHPEWQYLQDLCLEELNGDILGGYARCLSTSFFDEGEIIFGALNEYFFEAREICAYPSQHNPDPWEHNPAHYLTNVEDPTHIHENPAETPKSRLELKPRSAGIRIRQSRSHSKLANLCLVLADRQNVERAEAYRSCCPDASREPSSR